MKRKLERLEKKKVIKVKIRGNDEKTGRRGGGSRSKSPRCEFSFSYFSSYFS